MAGINTLRTRPGYSLSTSIVHAAEPETLLQPGATAAPSAMGLHHLDA